MSDTMAPGTRIGENGRYQIVKLLGAGAFGEVFLAHDLKLEGRPVAIKRLMPHARQQRETWGRFVQEVKILARLRHPNIIDIYDVDEKNDCIVLEFAEQGTLESMLEREGRLPVHQALEIAMSVLDALDAVHALCVWHRDLKPANILLDASGRVKVSDFGIAHAPDGNFKLVQTTYGQPGTPLYMSPEQIKGDPIDGRSDLWAVGVILYQLVTGRFHLPLWTIDRAPPHEQMVKLREMIVNQKAGPPSAANHALPKDVDAPILKALALNADERYATASEMKAALKRLHRKLPDPREASVAPSPPEVMRQVLQLASEEPSTVPFVEAAPPPAPAPPPSDPAPLASADDAKLLERAAAAGSPAAVAELLKPRADEPDAPTSILLAIAEANVQVRAYAVALVYVNRACQVRGASPDCWLVRGMCLNRVGRPLEVTSTYREGCLKHPRSAPLKEALAVALKNDGRQDEANRVLQEAHELDAARPSTKRLMLAWGLKG